MTAARRCFPELIILIILNHVIMKTKLIGMVATAGVAAVLLTGCVSSKKYKSSQAALQQVRNDSTRLAQQVASLNENVNALQSKSTALQRTLDSTNTNCATQQKSLAYYQNYFTQQQGAMSQVSGDLKNALSQAGLANADIQEMNNVIYVRLDENDIFKKNSTAVTAKGKQALNSVAQVVKARSDVNVTVADDDSASSQGNASAMSSSTGNENATATTSGNTGTTDMSANTAPAPRRHRTHHARKSTGASTVQGQSDATASSSANSNASGNSNATAQNSGKSSTTTTHKRVHRKYSSEGGMTYYNNGSRTSKSKAWALKQARMNMVASNFLQNGISKVNVSMTQPANGSQPGNNIKVVIMPTMSDFNPQTASTSTESK
jgi:outer membrane murein-binding lipoprotein Lpp